MKSTLKTAAQKRNAQAFWAAIHQAKRACIQQATLVGEVLVLSAKAFVNKFFRTQVFTKSAVDVDGFHHLHELEGMPSVTPGFVRLTYRQSINGHLMNRMSTLITCKEWEGFTQKTAFGEGRLSFVK